MEGSKHGYAVPLHPSSGAGNHALAARGQVSPRVKRTAGVPSRPRKPPVLRSRRSAPSRVLVLHMAAHTGPLFSRHARPEHFTRASEAKEGSKP